MSRRSFVTVFLMLTLIIGPEASGQILPRIARWPSDTSSHSNSQQVSPPVVYSSPDIRLNPQSYKDESEISIAVNPVDQQMILVGANTTLGGLGWYLSTNGGASWAGDDLLPGSAFGSDPTVAFDKNGVAYYCHDEKPCVPDCAGKIQLQVYDGTTWSALVTNIAKAGKVDKSFMAIDNTTIYLGWTDDVIDCSTPATASRVLFSRSTDGGQSFIEARDISSGTLGAGNTNPWANGVFLATGVNHELYAVWTIYDSWSCNLTSWPENGFGFNRSTDGGDHWDFGTGSFTGRGKRLTSSPGGANLLGSGIGGLLYKNPDPNPKGIRVYSFPSMAVDKSGGPSDGTIYLTWAQPGAIKISTSIDRGETWATPWRVNAPSNGDRWNPSITVNPDGIISIIYYDCRNDPANKKIETWVSQSSDGGATFNDSRVSDESFYAYPTGSGNYWSDYVGIASTRDVAFAAWNDARTIVTNPYTFQSYNAEQVFVDKFGSYKNTSSVTAGWNMVSVPSITHNFLIATLWPTATSAAFGRTGGIRLRPRRSCRERERLLGAVPSGAKHFIRGASGYIIDNRCLIWLEPDRIAQYSDPGCEHHLSASKHRQFAVLRFQWLHIPSFIHYYTRRCVLGPCQSERYAHT